MMRIGIPNGIVSASQLRAIGGITRKHARNLADITVRQNIQLHWLTIESLPEIVDALDAIGLSPKGACGDVVRNVTGCPLAGVAHDEIIDASPLALEIAHLLTANPKFYNLPRKFKISVTGCPSWCSYPEINDIALTPVKHEEQAGYSVRVGGGLSNEPHLAVRLNAFVLPHQALRVVRSHHRNLPRSARPARKPRPRAPQIPLHERRLDRRTLPRRTPVAARLQIAAGGSRAGSERQSFAITLAFIRNVSPD